MTEPTKTTVLARHVVTLAAFLLPALALWVPSGYSYGALLLLLGSLAFAPQWLARRPDRHTLGLALLLLGMGCMWFMLSLDTGSGRWDKGAKWILAVPCLLFAVACPPRPQAFFIGLPVGCVGMGAMSLWQTLGLGIERAMGHTNAIQWGNLALLLACLAAVPTALFWHRQRWPWRLGMGLAVALATLASLLSQSRGGWLALVAVFALWLRLVWQLRRPLFGRLLGASAALLVALVLVLGFTPRFNERIALAAAEINGYLEAGRGDTSLGLRLAQYGLVAQMIPQRPWLGWGAHGYVDEVQRRVDAGDYAAEMLRYPQVHNDFLDAWVKVGIGGVLLQVALHGWILAMFWPTRRRMARHAQGSPPGRTALALRAMGCVVPVAYVVFGLSQPFFNHHNGIMVFVFYVSVLWASLQGVERRPWPQPAPGGAR